MCNSFEGKEFPILEFDSNTKAKIEPSYSFDDCHHDSSIPEFCVIAFFGSTVDEICQEQNPKIIGYFDNCTVKLPVYEIDYEGKKVGLIKGFLGAAGSAAMLEELIAMGFKKFIVCGAAGVLQRGIQVGHLILPYSAIRDEGLSYHYAPPSREIACGAHAMSVLENSLKREKLPYIMAKTWTTDAFYRETADKVALRVAEGCVTVEMEAAALFAVAQFRKVDLAQILFGGDDLSGAQWDSRRLVSREQIRRSLVEFSIKTCLQL